MKWMEKNNKNRDSTESLLEKIGLFLAFEVFELTKIVKPDVSLPGAAAPAVLG